MMENVKIEESDKKKEQKEDIKILVVTHGGYIMEFYNMFKLLMLKKQPVY